MLFAASVRQRSLRVVRILTATFAAIVFSMLSLSTPAMAVDSSVSASVRDGLPTSITVTTAIHGAIVTSPTVTIEGDVHNISQVVVYVDSIYNTSAPLESGANTYMVAFGVTPGEHEVRVVGLDPYTNTEVSQTVQFTYEPAGHAVPGESVEGAAEQTTPETVVGNYVNKTIDVAVATGQDVRQQVQEASSSGPLGGLSDLTFSLFKSIDMVSPTDGAGINKMATRFTLVSTGLATSAFPLAVYSLIRKLHFIPSLTGHMTAAVVLIRIAGLALLSTPFLFLG